MKARFVLAMATACLVVAVLNGASATLYVSLESPNPSPPSPPGAPPRG